MNKGEDGKEAGKLVVVVGISLEREYEIMRKNTDKEKVKNGKHLLKLGDDY